MMSEEPGIWIFYDGGDGCGLLGEVDEACWGLQTDCYKGPKMKLADVLHLMIMLQYEEISVCFSNDGLNEIIRALETIK